MLWAVEVELVDFFARHELVDVDRAFALNRDGFELFRFDLEVLTLAHLIAFDDVGGLGNTPADIFDSRREVRRRRSRAG